MGSGIASPSKTNGALPPLRQGQVDIDRYRVTVYVGATLRLRDPLTSRSSSVA